MSNTTHTITLDGSETKSPTNGSPSGSSRNPPAVIQVNTCFVPDLDRVTSESEGLATQTSSPQNLREVKLLQDELQRYRASAGISSLAAERQSEVRVLGLTARELTDLATPWEMFSLQLTQQLQGLGQFKGLQLVSAPMSANWNDPRYGNFRAWRLLADTMPAWGPTYSPTGMQFTSGYYAFITNLDIPLPDPQDRAQAERARKTYMDAVDELNQTTMNLGDHWKMFNDRQSSLPQSRQLSFDEWYKRFDGQKIGSLNNKVNLAAQSYTSWLIKAYRGYAFVSDILTNYNHPAFQLSAESPDGLVNFYRTYNISPDLGAWIETSKRLVADGAPPKLSFSLTKDSGSRHTETTVWGGSASWFGGFFGFGASAGGSRTTVDVTNQHFRMDFSARNLDLFTVTPGQWFNGTAVKALKNGPFYPDGPVARGTLKLFNADGTFNLEPSQLCVAYRPRVTCSVTQDEFHQIKANFYASGGFSIGPFGFGASYNTSMDDVHFDDSSNTITAENASDVPQILAVVSKVLPDFE